MEWHKPIFYIRKNLRGEDKIDITLPGNGNNPANLITLSKNTHIYWKDRQFALKPLELSEDQKTLRLQFFWQKRQERSRKPRVDLCNVPESTEGRNHYADNVLVDGRSLDRIPRNDSKMKLISRPFIKTGDIFEMMIDNPKKRPLPSIAPT